MRTTRDAHRARRAREDGVAMAVAIAVAFVVILLSTAALSRSLQGINQSAVANKQVASIDSAEGGVAYLVDQISTQAASQASTFTCPAPTTVGSGAFQTTYTLAYLSAPSASSTSPTVPTGTPITCSGQSVALTGATSYLLQATGTTTSTAIGSKAVQALVYVPSAATYGKAGYWHDALFAGDDVYGNGSFKLTGGDTYSGSLGLCASNWSFGGNYFSNGATVPVGVVPITVSLPTTFAGACSVSGNLYMNNSLGISITGGSGVGGTVYTTGPVTMTRGAGVGGDVDADGPINFTGGTVGGSLDSASSLGVTTSGGITVKGNVYSAGGVTTSSGGTFLGSIYAQGAVSMGSSTVAGDIHAAGAVTLTSGTYHNVYAGGLVTIAGGATVSGTIYSNGGVADLNGSIGTVEDSGGSITYTSKASGPLYETGALIIPWPPYFGPTSTVASLPASFPTTFAVSLPSVTSTVSTALAAAASAVTGATQTTPSVTTPALTYDPQAWLANSSFCGSATCTTSSVNFVTNNDCNVNAGGALDPSSVWAVVAGMATAGAKPTVLQTDCQFTWGDSYLKGYTLPLAANLAIFDSAGFDFPTSLSGITSTTGTGTHQFYAIVPSTSLNVLPAVLSSLNPTAYPAGEAACGLLDGPDVIVDAPLTDASDNIQDFVYTPANVCSNGGNATVYGKVYAGQTFSATSNWNQTYFDISPYAQTGGAGVGASAPGTPSQVWVRQVASSSP